MKKTYFNPEAELLELFASDIITDSIDDGSDMFDTVESDEEATQEDTAKDMFTPLSK